MLFVFTEPSPESIKSILAITITDINNMTIVQIYNYGLVYMPFMSGELINGNTS